MAAGTITQTVGTTFTVGGIQQSINRVASFVRSVTSGMRGVGASTTGVSTDTSRMQRAFQASLTAMREAAERIAKAVRKALESITKISFKAMVKSAEAAFDGLKNAATKTFDKMKWAALGVVAAIGGIATAAVATTLKVTEMFAAMDKQSKTIGYKPGDIAALNFGLQQNGIDPEEIMPSLGSMTTGFKEINRQIDIQRRDLVGVQMSAWLDARTAAAKRDIEGINTAVQTVRDARLNSLEAVSARLKYVNATLDGENNRILSRDLMSANVNPYQNMIIQRRGDAASGRYGPSASDLIKERTQLIALKQSMEESFGPAGVSLFKLRDAGLDMNRALTPGIDGLYAVAEAFKNVTSEEQKLLIARGLFGDAGARMIPVLEGGAVGIEKYRKELDRLGGTVSERDTEMAAALNQSIQRRNTAKSGVQLEVFRALAEPMAQANEQMTEFMVNNRATLVKVFESVFNFLKNAMTDVFAFVEGKRSGFTSTWINSLITGFKTVKTFAIDIVDEVQAAFSSQSSRHEWLNALAYGIEQAKLFAIDLFKVFTGGSAETFKWMNDLKRQFDQFVASFKEAWGIFKEILSTIHSMLKPVLDLISSNPMTSLLVLGMLKFSGILSGISVLVGGLLKAVGGLFGLGAAGGTLATGLGIVGTAATGFFAIMAVGLAAMKVGYDALQASYDRQLDYTTQLVRQQGDRAFQPRHEYLLKNDRDYAARYWKSKGEDWVLSPSEEAAKYKNFVVGGQKFDWMTPNQMREQGAETERLLALKSRQQLDINISGYGLKGKATGDQATAEIMKQLAADGRRAR